MIGRIGVGGERAAAASTVDMSVMVGSVALANPVMTASGTAGHGAELAAYGDLAALGAVVVKSQHADPWPGNPPLRVHETAAGMINSVGLQGPRHTFFVNVFDTTRESQSAGLPDGAGGFATTSTVKQTGGGVVWTWRITPVDSS